MLNAGRHVDHLFAFGIEAHHVDEQSVSGSARPARWVALLGLKVQRVPCRQDGLILAGVTLLRADVADAAVTVINVVPAHEFSGPGAGCVQRFKALHRELRAVLGRAEQRLCKRGADVYLDWFLCRKSKALSVFDGA